jgi:hypothetical protein
MRDAINFTLFRMCDLRRFVLGCCLFVSTLGFVVATIRTGFLGVIHAPQAAMSAAGIDMLIWGIGPAAVAFAYERILAWGGHRFL